MANMFFFQTFLFLLGLCLLAQCQHQHQPHPSTLHPQHGHNHFHVKRTSTQTLTPSSITKSSFVATATRPKRKSPTFAATVNKKQSPTGFAKRSKDKKRAFAFENNLEGDIKVEDNDTSDPEDEVQPSAMSSTTMIDFGQHPTGFATLSKPKRTLFSSGTSSMRESATEENNESSETNDESESFLGEGGLTKILAVGLLMGAGLL